ncbi:hypothetical protein [Riemerella columbina]|uniref:hypothetical protein n=1 Tax=Riemerella columbina TaxID=103810 RepID=UPI00039D1188|nr:hypothetical protein [Riemerella columbina]
MKDEFKKQLEYSQKRFIETFNNSKYDSIRELYKNNFEKIKYLISESSPKLALEDIAEIEASLSKQIINENTLLEKINIAISEGKLKEKDIS